MRRLAQLDIVLLAAGVLVGTSLSADALVPATVGVFAGLVARCRFGYRVATAAVGFFIATIAAADTAPPGSLHPDLRHGAVDLLLRGQLAEGPRDTPRGSTYWLDVSHVDHRGSSARVHLAIAGARGDIVAGDVVEVFARCRPLAPADFPGVPGDLDRWRGRGFSARCSANEPIARVQAPATVTGHVLAYLTRRRLAVEAALHDTLGPRAGIPLAMLTGTRGFVSHSESRAHQRAGTAHLLAISGVHFGSLAMIAWLFGGAVCGRFARISRTIGARRASAGGVLAVMTAYVIFVGAPVSAIRAYVAVATLVLAVLARRRASGIAALAAAGVGLLLATPAAISDLGFQLSFTATLAIVLFWYRLPSCVDFDPWARERTGLRALGRFILMSWCATAATAPIILGATGELSVVSFATNLFAVPIVSLGIFPALVLGVLVARVNGPLGELLLRCGAEGMLRLTILLDACSELPGAVLTPGAPPGWWTALTCAAVIAAIAARLRPKALGVCIGAIATCSCLWSWSEDRTGWRIHFIPVGQGDATLIETPQRRRFLVDAGGSAFGRDPGRTVVVPYLRRAGITRLDAIIITHLDMDHVGGVPGVLDELDVGEVVTEPRALPEISVSRWSDTGSRNDRSLVVAIDTRRVRIALPGDVEALAEAAWASGSPHRIEVLKVAHHGSRTSTTAEFLRLARPLVAVVSAGRDNRFGHPHPAVVARLEAVGSRVYSTARHGLVLVTLDGDGRIAVHTARGP